MKKKDSTILVLEKQNIKKIENIENWINLRWLSLKDNNISKIENLEKLENLHILVLQNNNILKIENIEKLISLTVLDLDCNPLKEITKTSYDFIKKKKIKVYWINIKQLEIIN